MHYFLRIAAFVALLPFVFISTVSAQQTDSSTLNKLPIASENTNSPGTNALKSDTLDKSTIASLSSSSTAPSIGTAYSSSSYVSSIPTRTVYIDEYSSKISSIRSSIPLEYNSKVRSLISVYTEQRRNVSERILAYSDVYFPIFESVLSQYGIPSELKYLAICESALNTHAVSRSGAVGLWQMMGPTAKELHLVINDQIDERRDPYKATHAAARYLKKLYNKYGDWLLAMAAYNCGPGALDNAIRRSGGVRDFWLLHDYLPQETRSYVPSYIGATYLMHYYFDHYLRPVELEFPNAYAGSDTVLVRGPIHFAAITQYINVKEAELRFLNPAYKQEAIPQSNYPMSLRLPITEIGSFKQKMPQIYAYSQILNTAASGGEIVDYNYGSDNDSGEMSGSADADMPADGYEFKTIKKKTTVKTNKTQYYTVKKGDVLSKLADKFNCSIADIKRWNKLKSTKIERGDKIKIVKSASTTKYVPIRVAVPSTNTETVHTNQPSNYTDKNTDEGDNLLGMSLYDNDSDRATSSAYSNANVDMPKPKPYKETVTKTYTVKKGDNLIDIAHKLKCDVTELKRWNKIKSNHIDINDKLKYQTEVWVTPKNTASNNVKATTPSKQPVKVDINDLATLGNVNLYDNNIIIGDDATIASENLSLYGDLEADDADFVKTTTKYYTVKKGDALSEIATKHRCAVNDIKRWNKLKSNIITPGQQLKMSPDVSTMSDEDALEKAANAVDDLIEDVVVPTATNKPINGISNYGDIDWTKLGVSDNNNKQPITYDLRAEETIAPKNAEKPATKTITETITETYTVRKGDVLGEIAEKFNCNLSELKTWNRLKSTKIEAGDKLKIVRKVKKTVPVEANKTNPSSNEPKPMMVDIDDLESLGGINLYDNGVVIGDNMSSIPAATPNNNNTPNTEITNKPKATDNYIGNYKVKKGDTLWDIVQKYPKNTIESLCKLNGFNKKTSLQPGTMVKVKTK
jgi:membrane-bound lytic murein transglycosylase D